MRNLWQLRLNETFPSLFTLFTLFSCDFHLILSCSILISQHLSFSIGPAHRVLPFFFTFQPAAELLFPYIFTSAIELPEDQPIAV